MKLLVVVPVLNEERDLPRSIPRLARFVAERMPRLQATVLIADNGSADGTLDAARRLAEQHDNVAWSTMEQRGRGRALRKAWLESDADVLAYMDCDLSADLQAFPELVQRVLDGWDVAIGSRHHPASRVQRSWVRGIPSRGYNLVVRGLFDVTFRDAQCGFKAISRGAAQALVPSVRDQHWFFDTELLILAEACGYRVAELALAWDEDLDSTVHVVGTAVSDLVGLTRLHRGGLRRAVQEVRARR